MTNKSQDVTVEDDFNFDPFGAREALAKQAKADKPIEDDFNFDPFGAREALANPVKRSVPQAPGRFRKIGPNSRHTLTNSMRKMKTELGFTTRQLVQELTDFEQEHGFDKDDHQGVARDYMPMNEVLMASYLQGWVLGDAHMSTVQSRIARLYAHKMGDPENSPAAMREVGVRATFDKWFEELEIKEKGNSAPVRVFARIIAPYYKRVVSAKFDGAFHLGKEYGDIEQKYTITSDEGVVHHFVLNRAEEVLVKSGATIKRGDIIQYAVLYPLVMNPKGELRFDQSSPSADHTTFFRWYNAKRPPRSLGTMTLVEEAVKQARLAMSSEL